MSFNFIKSDKTNTSFFSYILYKGFQKLKVPLSSLINDILV